MDRSRLHGPYLNTLKQRSATDDACRVYLEQICREHGISPNTFYVWKRKYGATSEPDVKRLRELEKENARLKRLLAERDVELDVMKGIVTNKLPL